MDVNKINLRILTRHDPLVQDILDSTGFCAIYEFTNNKWNRKNIEGTLCFFKRKDERMGLFIMNRQSTENLLLFFDDMEIDRIGDYILYRLSSGIIQGLWISDMADRSRIYSTIEMLASQNPTRSYPISTPVKQRPSYQPIGTPPIAQPFHHSVSPHTMAQSMAQSMPNYPMPPMNQPIAAHPMALNLYASMNPIVHYSPKASPVVPRKVIDLFSEIEGMSPIESIQEFHSRIQSSPVFIEKLYLIYKESRGVRS